MADPFLSEICVFAFGITPSGWMPSGKPSTSGAELLPRDHGHLPHSLLIAATPVPSWGTTELVPETEEHLAFARQVFDSTRQREFEALDWTGDQREAFLSMPFSAQRRHHRQHCADADWRMERVAPDTIA